MKEEKETWGFCNNSRRWCCFMYWGLQSCPHERTLSRECNPEDCGYYEERDELSPYAKRKLRRLQGK